jgi:hypothetical protein
LKINKDIIILKDDKGKAIVILDEFYYNNKIIENNTCGVDRNIGKYPMKKIMCVVSTTRSGQSLYNVFKKKTTPKNTIMPWIYGAPKIHKDGVPLRLIVNMIGFFTYSLIKLIQVDISGHSPLSTGSHTIFILAVFF